jgi:formate dehydrogenase maturation protein FdhE
MVPLLLAAVLATTAPPADALRLGRKLAEQGTLASLLPLMKAKEVDELLAEDRSLSAADQTKLRATADRVFERGYDRLMDAIGTAYAKQLSVKDLRTLTRLYASPAAVRYRQVMPQVILATMQSVGQMDFKGDVRKAFCAETKRLCPKD